MGIQNSPLIEVAIGLVFLYLVFGLICTAVNEMVAQAFSLRAETLWGAVRALLQDPGGVSAAKDLYNHHLIRSLAVRSGSKMGAGGVEPNLRSKPSYIPASLFSLALIDMISNPEQKAATVARATTTQLLANLPHSGLPVPVQQALAPLIQSAGGSTDQARANIEAWYDAAMERASGWYKQRVQKITLFVAFLTVFFANADTIMFADRLWVNPVERSQLVEAARNYPPPGSLAANPAAAPSRPIVIPMAETDHAPASADKLPIIGADGPAGTGATGRAAQIPAAMQGLLGWSGPVNPSERGYSGADPRRFPRGVWAWLVKLLGLLLTAIAASLGAPFWFDTLNKIMNIRSAGPSPNETPRRPARRRDADARIPSTPHAAAQPAVHTGPGAQPGAPPTQTGTGEPL